MVRGGSKLHGSVEISGMKNAALPVIMAAMLVPDECIIENLPAIDDVATSLEILRRMGADVTMLTKTSVKVNAKNFRPGESEFDLVKRIRASYYLLGAELGRFGRANVGYPGGCDFGSRPIDQHIKGFEALGAKVDVEGGYIIATTSSPLVGKKIHLDGIPSVGATVNIMLAAVMAQGTTTIENAAREPHIVDLANFLNTCGADISGAGTSTVRIRGVKQLHGCTYSIIPDMIEAGTYMIAAAAAGGSVTVTNLIPKHMEAVTAKLIEMGVGIEEGDDWIKVERTDKLKKVNVKTMPYPGFPTDVHPQMSVLLCLSEGVSFMTESVFDNRFRYIDELRRMGADVKVDGKTAIFEEIEGLSGAKVTAVDLRGGAAVIIAGLTAAGVTEVDNIQLIERGYDDIVQKLKDIGADISKKVTPEPEALPKAN